MPRNEEIPSPDQEQIVVGNYILEKTIGQGSYGKVKLAYNKITNEKFAVKVIEKSRLKSQKQVGRLQREIRFLKLLYHPHIIKVYDVIETPQHIYIMMEYAKGGELFDYIVANKRVREKEARSFFRQMLSAIDYCHHNAVIHRDLKPENLLLDDKKCIKIIDFGFGNNYSDDKLLDTFCGSPFYAAPEMILGRKYLGPEVDMWSLGVILFALLCGHLPFDDDDIQQLYKKIACGAYTIPEYVSSPAKHLIDRLITVDPSQRATMKEILVHPWVLEGYESIASNYLPERQIIRGPSYILPDINRRLNAFGYIDQDIIKAFNHQYDHTRPNPIRSTYFLLCEMLKREEMKMHRRKLRQESLSKQTLVNEGESSTDLVEKNVKLSLLAIADKPPMAIKNKSSDGMEDAMQVDHPPFSQSFTESETSTNSTLSNETPESARKPPSASSRIRDEIKTVSGWFGLATATTTIHQDTLINLLKRIFIDTRIQFTQPTPTSFICEVDIQSITPTFPAFESTDQSKQTHHSNKDTINTDPKLKLNQIRIQIEIKKVRGDFNGIYFKRLNGGVWNYKKVCHRILTALKL